MEILSDPTPDMLAMPRFDDGAIDMQELLRRLAEQVVNAVMDAEADQLCGGGANSRNGYRERSLATCVGALTQRIPKLRSGSFFPEDVLERYQRVDRALVAAVAEMYATGTSTRKVQRVAEKMEVSPRATGRPASAACPARSPASASPSTSTRTPSRSSAATGSRARRACGTPWAAG